MNHHPDVTTFINLNLNEVITAAKCAELMPCSVVLLANYLTSKTAIRHIVVIAHIVMPITSDRHTIQD